MKEKLKELFKNKYFWICVSAWCGINWTAYAIAEWLMCPCR